MANKYFVFSGTNYSTGLTANWATYSGGPGGTSLPTSSDSIYFDFPGRINKERRPNQFQYRFGHKIKPKDEHVTNKKSRR